MAFQFGAASLGVATDRFYFTGNGESLSGSFVPANSRYDFANWHLYTFTWSGGQKQIYFDGVRVFSGPAGFSTTSAGDVVIGAPGTARNEMLNGSVDDLKIWGRALTADEVLSEYVGPAVTGDACGESLDFTSGVPAGPWVFVPRSRSGALSPTTGVVQGRLHVDGTDDDVIIGRRVRVPSGTLNLMVAFDVSIPAASAGTGSQVYALAPGRTDFVAAGYSGQQPWNWYVDMWDTDGTSPATPISVQLPNTGFTRLNQSTFDTGSGPRDYRQRILFRDGRATTDLTRLTGEFVASRTDMLPGFAVSSLDRLFLQLYHTSPGVLWADNLGVACGR